MAGAVLRLWMEKYTSVDNPSGKWGTTNAEERNS
jgi:hypothetical protein